MKFEEFFYIVKNIKDKENSQEKIDGIDDDNKVMVINFDDYLGKKLRKNNKDKAYNQKLIELIKNFPLNIRNMKETKKINNRF